MATQYDPVNRVNVGDSTQKAHFDQLLGNSVVVGLVTGRVIARAGMMSSWISASVWTPIPESFPFKLPASSDCVGFIIRMAGYLQVEAAGQSGSVRLEYFDGAAWVAVANSAVTWGTTTFNNPTYLESVNVQANLFSVETLYRFTSQMDLAGRRMRGVVFLTTRG